MGKVCSDNPVPGTLTQPEGPLTTTPSLRHTRMVAGINIMTVPTRTANTESDHLDLTRTIRKSTATQKTTITQVSEPGALLGICSTLTYKGNHDIRSAHICKMPTTQPPSSTIHLEEHKSIPQPPQLESTTGTDHITVAETDYAETSTTSTRCFDTALQKPGPCSSTSPVPAKSSASNDLPFRNAPPGTSVILSQGNRLAAPPTVLSTSLVAISVAALVWIVLTRLAFNRRLDSSGHHRGDSYRHENHEDNVTAKPIKSQSNEIELVQGSGRRLSSASYLGREIVLVRETARLYKQPREIEKEDIQILSGSGRSLD